MTPQFATILFAIGILALFRLDREPKEETSIALWLPIAWLAIGGSRVVSAWLDPTAQVSAAEAYLNGNPLDRGLQGALLSIALIVLYRRRHHVLLLLSANKAVLYFFLYCGMSMLWSEYPDTLLRKWIKALGDLAMVLVVLTDRDPQAINKLPARVAFFLIPTSVLLIKYTDLGRFFNYIDGEVEYTGVATSKNGLGLACMVFGLGTVWRFLEAYRNRRSPRRAIRLMVHGTVVAMALWLFSLAHSMTSLICFTIGVALFLTAMFTKVPQSRTVHLLVGGILLGTFSIVVLGAGTALLESLGRDPTLTGRTVIWRHVLGMVTNPWFGTGFESFWLGARLDHMLTLYRGINQAHNGYIELFINLGWSGIVVFFFLVKAGYRNVIVALRAGAPAGAMRLAFFTIGLVFNFSEAAFEAMSPIWIFFLLAVIAVPAAPTVMALHKPGKTSTHRHRPAAQDAMTP